MGSGVCSCSRKDRWKQGAAKPFQVIGAGAVKRMEVGEVKTSG